MIGTLHEWTPASDVTDHVGNALEADRVFFAPPPMEIGKIISAYSTILRNKNPNPPLPRVIAALALGGLAAFFAWMGLQDGSSQAVLGMGVLVAGSLGAFLGYKIIRKTNVCTYVGESGVARYNIKNLNDTPRQSDLLRFADVAELRTRQTRNYYNGVYTGTTYNYTWSGGSGNRPFTLSGTYHSSKGDPPPGDAFRFACAAEAAWSAFAFERAKTDLQRNGAVRFSLQHNNYLVVGEGYIELFIGGKTARCNTEEIARVTINQGVVTLRRTDARSGFFGIGAQGIFTFSYSDIGNARLFLILLDHLVGVDFS